MNTTHTQRMLLTLACAFFGVMTSQAAQPAVQAPSLSWVPRSDWRSVKSFGAVGDGVADDTAAIQRAFDTLQDNADILTTARSRVVYFPPGTYRLTGTLTITNSTGAYVVGHGRDSTLSWYGPAGGSMYWSNGATSARYQGLTFDGRGIAAIGAEHRSMCLYETSLRYQHCAFYNFTDSGVSVGKNAFVNPSAEFWFNACVFANCGSGVSFLSYNDYNNTFDNCEFRNCAVGVNNGYGNFELRTSHFEGSTDTDIRLLSPSHGSSVRLCTSVGSRRFCDLAQGTHQAFTIQDCRIDSWTGTNGAIWLGKRGPTTIFDCVFTRPPNAFPPIRLNNPAEKQQVLILSNNRSDATTAVLDPGPNSRVTEIPPGSRSPVLTNALQTFLPQTVPIPTRVFDAVVDFGASADGHTDDSSAIQKCIDAARAYGRKAIAYLPGGLYSISKTLDLHGADYSFGSTGARSFLSWSGAADGVAISVTDPRNVTLEHLSLWTSPKTVSLVRQTSVGLVSETPSSIYYDGLILGICGGNGVGMELVSLSPKTVVRIGQVEGPVRLRDSGQAVIVGAVHFYELVVEGASLPKTGFAGFMFHSDACHDYGLEVRDNQDIVIADYYMESSKHLLSAAGGSRPGFGKITVGAKKISPTTQQVLSITNYEGRLFVGGADVYNQTNWSAAVAFTHTGTRPLDLVLAANAFWETNALYQVGAGARLIGVENILIQNKYPAYDKASLPNQIPSGGLAAMAAALDDFRDLAYHYVNVFNED